MMKTVKHLSVLLALLFVVSLAVSGFTVNAQTVIMPTSPDFAQGTIERTENGVYTIGTDGYTAFLSHRDSLTQGAKDYRILIAIDEDLFFANSDVKLSFRFIKNDEAVKSLLDKDIYTGLNVYTSATAAGSVYVAADGCLLTGMVVTGVPTDAWDAVNVAITNAEGEVLGAGTVKAEDIEAHGEPTPFNVTLPEGLTAVEPGAFKSQDLFNWADGADENLFDGNTTSTKIGGGAPEGNVTIFISFAEPTTLTYYTLYTGNDTTNNINSFRNPISWKLYGIVGDQWVVLHDVNPDVADIGLRVVNSTPFSYKVASPAACTRYKIVFELDPYNDAPSYWFQLNEMVLYVNE